MMKNEMKEWEKENRAGRTLFSIMDEGWDDGRAGRPSRRNVEHYVTGYEFGVAERRLLENR